MFYLVSVSTWREVSCRQLSWERADLIALMFSCVFDTFPYGVLGQVWFLIALIADLCLLPYFTYWPFPNGASLVTWVSSLSLSYFLICSLQPVKGLTSLVSCIWCLHVFSTRSHILSWLRCSIWLYWLLIFAFFLTLLTDRSKAVLFCGFFLSFEFVFVFVIFSCLFIAALWSPAGKGLTSLLSCIWCFIY